MQKILFKNSKLFVLMTIALVLFNTALVIIIPVTVNNVFDESNNIEKNNIIFLVGVILVSFIIQLILVVVRQNFAVKFNTNNMKKFLKNMFEMDYDSLLEKEPTYLIERIFTTVNSFYMFMMNGFTTIVSSFLIIVVSIIMLLNINLYIAILFTVTVPINYYGFKILNKKLQEKSMVMQKITSESAKDLIAICSNVDFVKQLDDYNILTDLVESNIHNMFQASADVNKYAQFVSSLLRLFNDLVKNFTFILISSSILINNSKLSDLVVISILVPIFFTALSSITGTNLQLTELTTSNDFIENEVISNAEKLGSSYIEKIENIKLDIKNITRSKKQFSADIKGEYKKGDIVYVSGPSGSGKSTFLKLLLSFRSCENIFINDILISEIHQSSLRKRIGYMPQTPTILPLTIKENILFGSDYKELSKDFANNKLLSPVFKGDKNLDTKILEGGSNLSGGERQRIALMRILENERDVLILDEITSNLDKDTTIDIFNYIKEVGENKIIFIVSHDEDVKKYCNKELEIKINFAQK